MWIKNFARELGFDDVRVARADQGTPYAEQFLSSLVEKRHGPLDYLSKTAAERSDVLTLMPTAKSVIVVAKNYYFGDHGEAQTDAAKVSRYAWGGDYHHWFKKRLRKFREEILKRENPDAKVHIFNDTGPVLERGWAERAGLGFIGKSGMLIHREFGTWIFLGGFVTDVEFAADKPTPKQLCGSCTACMDACPTQAIIAPRTIDANLCLTTWNVERAFHEEAKQIQGHGWAIGCDICQEACPWNKFQQMSDDDRFKPRDKQMWLRENELPEKIEGTPLARAGRQALDLNVRRALSK